eukprot:CAMPEP_0176143422 /NCGR_PEP_ID=MMETSP0120_2-20121206/73000_1 /TAXON_ID=160619 /ORGANISM="Kryptoperidinium foliaceum, Strain CCMP 1326" /LENGTH=709 /DNA_ID=CAMNT_0017479733 /DNA_START=17 /DNA_END=2146 /DNA_ORIENTATION=+
MEIAPDIDCGGADFSAYSSSQSETRSRSGTAYSRRTNNTRGGDLESAVDSQLAAGKPHRALYTALAEEALLGASVPCDPESTFEQTVDTTSEPLRMLDFAQGSWRTGATGTFWKVDAAAAAGSATADRSARCCVAGEEEWRPWPRTWSGLALCVALLLLPVAAWDVHVWLGSSHAADDAGRFGCCTFAAAACFSCMAGISVSEFCYREAAAQGIAGCQGRPCCDAPTAKCLACSAGLNVSQFCATPAGASLPDCAAAPREACGLVEDGYEYVGGDLYSVGHVTSWAACCTLCQEEDRCTSWSFESTRCFLKRQAQLRTTPSRGYTSGLRGPDAMEFHIRHRRGTCLAFDGGLLELQECNSSTFGQHWIFQRGPGRLKTAVGDRCLDVADLPMGAVAAQPCSSDRPGQRWSYESDSGELRTRHGELCMRVAGSAGEAWKVVMRECPGSTSPQEWGFWSSALLNRAPTVAAMRAQSTSVEPSLFCFSVMVSWSHEPSLVRMQASEHKSIFNCDGFAVYSDKAIALGSVTSRVVRGTDLKCYHSGGEFNTLQSTSVFVKVWEQVVSDGLYAPFDWTVKADPDAVFFPVRLRRLLSDMASLGNAMGGGVIFNNCGFGLHGALEVFSRRAVEVYGGGWATCEQPSQESAYLQACMVKLGAEQVNQFSLLSEASCRTPNWQACQSEHVAFHPFKSVDAYVACEQRADAAERLMLG